jgi:fructose-1-phosphate kinase PfkB-like protein
VEAVPSEVVDTLGAGDSFIGRALYGLIRGEPMPELLAASARAAARTCTAWGAYGHGVRLSTSTCCGVHDEAVAATASWNPNQHHPEE